MWTHKEVDLAPHPVFGLVLPLGDAEKFPHALVSRPRSLFAESASRVRVSLAVY